MNIKDAKNEIIHTLAAYLKKDGNGAYTYPLVRQRPILLIGPPGIGKTAVMEQVAAECRVGLVAYTITHHTRQSAVGLPKIVTRNYGGMEIDITEYTMSEIIASVYEYMEQTGKKEGILFIDEIHRFNKSQQDYLLPFVEDGTVTLIGATTENPYFEVNNALLSRSRIFELKPLEKQDIRELVLRAVYDEKKGMGAYGADITDEAADFLADVANGDARAALNAVELGILTTKQSEDGKVHITLPVAAECIQKRAVRYDKDGDNHYDTVSAFIKSMRGSDPDAAVYYLGRLLAAGDLLSPCRRLLVIAAEDVGLAYPQAIVVTKACVDAALQLGLPEGRLPLAEAAVLLATAPKSNSAHNAIIAAMQDIDHGKVGPVPRHLQNVHADSAGTGKVPTYKYPHVYPNHYVKQQYLPDLVKDAVYYEYGPNKTEQAAKRYWDEIKGDSASR